MLTSSLWPPFSPSQRYINSGHDLSTTRDLYLALQSGQIRNVVANLVTFSTERLEMWAALLKRFSLKGVRSIREVVYDYGDDDVLRCLRVFRYSGYCKGALIPSSTVASIMSSAPGPGLDGTLTGVSFDGMSVPACVAVSCRWKCKVEDDKKRIHDWFDRQAAEAGGVVRDCDVSPAASLRIICVPCDSAGGVTEYIQCIDCLRVFASYVSHSSHRCRPPVARSGAALARRKVVRMNVGSFGADDRLGLPVSLAVDEEQAGDLIDTHALDFPLGWARRKPMHSQRLSDEVKEFLHGLFLDGERRVGGSGRFKLTGEDAFADMLEAVDADGQPRFDVDMLPTPDRIKNFFHTQAAKRKKTVAAAAAAMQAVAASV